MGSRSQWNVAGWLLVSLFLCVSGLISGREDCPVPGNESFTLEELPSLNNKTVTVPPLPKDINTYRYATDNAMVAVPVACAREHAAKLKTAVELDDKPPCGPKGMQYLRIYDLEGGYDTLAAMANCSYGLVIGFHGSGGPGWDAVQYAGMLSGLGFVHLIPDSQSMPNSYGLKGRRPHIETKDIKTTDYCGEYACDQGICGDFNKPYCYTTNVDNILHDSWSFRKYYEGVYQIRKRELDYFFEHHAGTLTAFASVFAIGNSEGGMVVSRYHHPVLDKVLSGRIIDSWSCEFNYFVACPEDAQICQDACDKHVPQLNVIGSVDEYFGAVDSSVAYKVQASPQGYGADPLTGNCRKAFDDQGFTQATVVVFEDAGHGPMYYNGNKVRAVVADFVSKRPLAGALATCRREDGVYSCPPVPDTCTTIDGEYQLNPDSPCEVLPPVEDSSKLSLWLRRPSLAKPPTSFLRLRRVS